MIIGVKKMCFHRCCLLTNAIVQIQVHTYNTDIPSQSRTYVRHYYNRVSIYRNEFWEIYLIYFQFFIYVHSNTFLKPCSDIHFKSSCRFSIDKNIISGAISGRRPDAAHLIRIYNIMSKSTFYRRSIFIFNLHTFSID